MDSLGVAVVWPVTDVGGAGSNGSPLAALGSIWEVRAPHDTVIQFGDALAPDVLMAAAGATAEPVARLSDPLERWLSTNTWNEARIVYNEHKAALHAPATKVELDGLVGEALVKEAVGDARLAVLQALLNLVEADVVSAFDYLARGEQPLSTESRHERNRKLFRGMTSGVLPYNLAVTLAWGASGSKVDRANAAVFDAVRHVVELGDYKGAEELVNVYQCDLPQEDRRMWVEAIDVFRDVLVRSNLQRLAAELNALETVMVKC
jgi:hypothetical protein